MKTFRVFGLDICFSLRVRSVKRLSFDLPDWADDCCVTTTDVDDKVMAPKIKYYRGSTRYYIDLPKCREAHTVSLTPLTGIVDGKRVGLKNRKIVVDIFN